MPLEPNDAVVPVLVDNLGALAGASRIIISSLPRPNSILSILASQ